MYSAAFRGSQPIRMSFSIDLIYGLVSATHMPVQGRQLLSCCSFERNLEKPSIFGQYPSNIQYTIFI